MTQANITLADIFRSSILAKAVESFSVMDTLIILGVSFLLGLLIFQLYKRTYMGVMYSRSFNVSLIVLIMIAAMVISAVTNNVILSLGMVGALSIIRFRTAVKDPMDMVYLFWSIATGIIVGAGMLLIAVLSALAIGIVVFILSTHKLDYQPYLLIVNLSTSQPEKQVTELTYKHTLRHSLKSKSIRVDGVCELVFEISIKQENTELINRLSELTGVENAVLVAYNGDYSI